MLPFPVMFEILYSFIAEFALNFFTYRHIHSLIHHHNLMKLCGIDRILHRLGFCIAVSLCNPFQTQFFHTAFGVFIFGVFQLYNVAVLHARIDIQ